MNVLAAMKSFMSTWELAFQTLMRPPIALCWQFFATALLIDFSASWEVQCIIFTARVLEYAVATAIIPPGLQKLQGVASFSAMFLNYDLHAQRQVPFSYVYLHA